MEYRPYYLAREWVARGHDVTILAASYSHLRSRQPVTSANATEELIDGVRYIWLLAPEYHGNGAGRVRNMAIFLARVYAWWRSERQRGWDCVIASSTYPWDIWPARSIAGSSRAGLVFEVHDLWPLTPVELGGMTRYHPFIASLTVAERTAYKCADRVVSLLPATTEHMVARGMHASKFSWIPNGISRDALTRETEPLPMHHEAVMCDIRKRARLVVGYAGSHGLANALDTVVRAARYVTPEQIHFVLVGDGPEKPMLRVLAESSAASNVHFLPPIPKASIPAFLQQIDVACLAWRQNSLYRFGISPNKLLDYMAAGKPIVHAVSAANDLVTDASCGIPVPPDDPRAIAGAVRRLSVMPAEERNEMGERGRRFVLRELDYGVLAERFLAVLEDATCRARSNEY